MITTQDDLAAFLRAYRPGARLQVIAGVLRCRWSDELTLSFLVTEELISVATEAAVSVPRTPRLLEHIALHNVNWSVVPAKVGIRSSGPSTVSVTVQQSIPSGTCGAQVSAAADRVGEVASEFFGEPFRAEFGGSASSACCLNERQMASRHVPTTTKEATQ